MSWEDQLEDSIRFYKDIGASLIPIVYGDKRPDASMLPNGSWKPFQQRQPTDSEIDSWFFSGVRRNVAIVLGAVSGNLFVMDLDSKELVQYFREKVPKFFTNTLVVGTSKGAHIYAYSSHPIPTMRFETPYGGMDIKGEGGYVLVPPSKHPSGRFYRFINKTPPMRAYIPGKADTTTFLETLFEELFPNLVPLLKERLGQRVTSSPTTLNFPDMPLCLKNLLKGVSEGNRNNSAFLLAAYLTKLMPTELVEQLLMWWNSRNKPPLPTSELLRVIDSAKGYEVSCRAIRDRISIHPVLCTRCEYRSFMRPANELYKVEAEPQPMPMEETPSDIREYVFVPSLRPGQLEVIRELLLTNDENIILKAPTGWGKTIAFLAKANQVGGTVIVEPYKPLQDQVGEKYKVYVVKGKNAYICPLFNVRADLALCNFMYHADGSRDEDIYEEIRQKLDERGVTSCADICPYKQAVSTARLLLAENQNIVVNHGNMFLFYPHAKYLIIDEFHKVIEQMATPIRLHHVEPDDLKSLDLEGILQKELVTTAKEIESLKDSLIRLDPNSSDYLRTAEDLNKKKWHYNRVENLMEDIDHVIVYEKELEGGRKFVYAKYEEEGVVKRILQWKKPKLLVSATPTPLPRGVKVKVIEAEARFLSKGNAPIIYYPIAKLTSHAVRRDRESLKLAADAIKLFYGYLYNNGRTQKGIVHSGNTHNHGRKLTKYLQPYKVVLHEKGKLDETIAKFKESDAHFLVIASGDVGFDFYGDDYLVQFIAKVPYPAWDEEWEARQRKYGIEKTTDLYNKKTVDTILQIVGRICRGGEDRGYTIILDSKFADLFRDYFDYFDKDFIRRLVDLSPMKTLERIIKEKGDADG